MKRHTIKSLVASLAIALCGIPAGAYAGPSGSAKGSDCKSIGAGVRQAVAANPSQMLVIVEDAMIANGACACEIVKAAILGSGANSGTAEANALVKQIVHTAITVNPGMASVIVECAMAVAPGASAEIQAALADALGDGKGVAAAGGGSDFGGSPADVRGIYLVPPLASGSLLVQEVVERVETVRERERVIIRRNIPVPVSPSSGR